MNENQLLQTLVDDKGVELVNIDELNAGLDRLLDEYNTPNAPKVPPSEIETIIKDANSNLIVGNWFYLNMEDISMSLRKNL